MAQGWRVKDPAGFADKLVQGLHIGGDSVFDKSQRYVPVDEGTLKGSGVLEKHARGFRILYRTSYAARQEFGLPVGHTEEVREHTVKRYRTKRFRYTSKKGKVIQMPAIEHPEHTRGPFTRVFKEGYKGRFYLTRAWDEEKPRIISFITRLYKRSR